MSKNSDLREPLISSGNLDSGDDAASQSSQRSGASLLERIRMQRERDAAAAASALRQDSTPSTIQVPQYSSNVRVSSAAASANQAISRDPLSESAQPQAPVRANSSNLGGGGSFFTQAWNNISYSMESGMASLQQERGDLETQDALLAPTAEDEENYSIIGYFFTFVRDVYGTFVNLPLWVRVVIIFALLYTAWKLF